MLAEACPNHAKAKVTAQMTVGAWNCVNTSQILGVMTSALLVNSQRLAAYVPGLAAIAVWPAKPSWLLLE